MTARDAALFSLKEIRRSKVFAAEAIEGFGLDGKDRALCRRLVMGTIQNYRYLDWVIKGFTSLSKLEPAILDILRLCAYQLLFLDKIPKSAAVNEAVEQAKRASKRASSLVNAVARRISELPGKPELPRDKDYLELKYSLPKWFIRRLIELLGEEETEAFCKASNTIPPLGLWHNPFKTGFEGYFESQSFGELERGLEEGLCVAADKAVGRVIEALDPVEGACVWDTCAAPGGKSLLSAFKMKNKGMVLATDISEKRLRKLSEASKLCEAGIIKCVKGDAGVYRPEMSFDAVLCDVPCSGFGVLRRKPDIRFKTAEEIEPLPEVQLRILKNAALYVKIKGRLVYSTCTVLPEENNLLCDRFLKENGGFERVRDDITLWPHIDGTDGFFICEMRRV